MLLGQLVKQLNPTNRLSVMVPSWKVVDISSLSFLQLDPSKYSARKALSSDAVWTGLRYDFLKSLSFSNPYAMEISKQLDGTEAIMRTTILCRLEYVGQFGVVLGVDHLTKPVDFRFLPPEEAGLSEGFRRNNIVLELAEGVRVLLVLINGNVVLSPEFFG